VNHTPGPWEFRSDGLYSGEFPILWVTQGYSGELYLGAFEDDTHIIITAPELYEALSPFAARYARIVREGERPLKVLVPFEWLGQAAAAIAKAEGREP
jgi:hypothetical protein